MSYTIKYLKYVAAAILATIAVVCLIGAVIFTLGIGIYAAALEAEPEYLIFIPVGIFVGMMGCGALDVLRYVCDNWLKEEKE